MKKKLLKSCQVEHQSRDNKLNRSTKLSMARYFRINGLSLLNSMHTGNGAHIPLLLRYQEPSRLKVSDSAIFLAPKICYINNIRIQNIFNSALARSDILFNVGTARK